MKKWVLLLLLCIVLLLAAPAFARTYTYEDMLYVVIPNDWETTETVVSKNEAILSLCGTEPGFMQIDVYVSSGGTIYDRDELAALVEQQYASAQAKVTYMNGTKKGQQVAYWEGQVENGPVYGATLVADGHSYTFLCGAYVDAEHTAMRELTAADFSQLYYIVSSIVTNAFFFPKESAELEYPFEIVTYTDKDGNEIRYATEKEHLRDKSSTIKTKKDDNGLPVMKIYDYKGVLDYIIAYDPEQSAWVKTTADGEEVNKSYFDEGDIWTIVQNDGSVITYTLEGIRIVTHYKGNGFIESCDHYNGNTRLVSESYERGKLAYRTSYDSEGSEIIEVFNDNGALKERTTYPLDGSRITVHYDDEGKVTFTSYEGMNSKGKYVTLPNLAVQQEETEESSAPLFASFDEAMSAYQELEIKLREKTDDAGNITQRFRTYYKEFNGEKKVVANEIYDSEMNLTMVLFMDRNDDGSYSTRAYNPDGTQYLFQFNADADTVLSTSLLDENGDWVTTHYDSSNIILGREITALPVPLF